jgi:hypothetical protein
LNFAFRISRGHYSATYETRSDPQHKIRPVVDRVFPFEDAAQAYEFMDNGSYFGKIVIRVGG